MAIGGVLFDIDGVLVTSWQPIAGAAAALRALADNQIACSYLTNTTTRTRAQIAEALSAAGMAVHADEVITSAVLTADFVRGNYPDARCFLVNSGDIAEDLAGIDIVSSAAFSGPKTPDTPDVILLGGAGPEYSHLTLSWVYDWMAQGVPVVAMHRSTAWTTTDGLRIDTGLYLIGMEEASGRKATAVGKPAPAGFLAAAARLGADPEQMYMVGDDLNNDVLAGQVVGMTGVLVRTGKFRQDTLDRWAADEFAMQPNHVIDSVADLPGLLGLEAIGLSGL
jgi:HAD superfamily hydrolase (TIGR01450 family)